MAHFVSVSPKFYRLNPFDGIGERGMLITATKPDGTYNTMTASWGGLGVLWGKNVCTIYIRPQRHTFQFVEAGEKITLSFFDEKYANVLRTCGTTSGRDTDKAALCGLTPCRENGAVYFAEANSVILARKLYADDIKEDAFFDTSCLSHYKAKDFHRMYICEIEGILTKIS